MSTATKRKVLVLNKTWNPCSIVTLRRAISLLCKEYAEIIDPHAQFQTYTWEQWEELQPAPGEEFVSSAKRTFRIPEIIRLYGYDKLRLQSLNFSRSALRRRDHSTCMYCGDQPGADELTIDHVLPKAQGGRTSWENCVIACVSCNAMKAARTPEQAGMKFFKKDFKPFKPRYNLYKGDIRMPSWGQFLGDKD